MEKKCSSLILRNVYCLLYRADINSFWVSIVYRDWKEGKGGRREGEEGRGGFRGMGIGKRKEQFICLGKKIWKGWDWEGMFIR